MNKRANNILLLVRGMHNTRSIQYATTEWNEEVYNALPEYPWGELFFEYYVSVLEKID